MAKTREAPDVVEEPPEAQPPAGVVLDDDGGVVVDSNLQAFPSEATDEEVARLRAAIELKSINGSLGKNLNNRIEEALGTASDFQLAKREGLVPAHAWSGYVLLVADVPELTRGTRSIKASGVDASFEDSSYWQRISTFASRLLSEGLYDAVWVPVCNSRGEWVDASPGGVGDFIASLTAALSSHPPRPSSL